MSAYVKGTAYGAVGGAIGYALSGTLGVSGLFGAFAGAFVGVLAWAAGMILGALLYMRRYARRESKDPKFLEARQRVADLLHPTPVSEAVMKCKSVNNLTAQLVFLGLMYKSVKGEAEIKIRDELANILKALTHHEEYFTIELRQQQMNVYQILTKAGMGHAATKVRFALGPEEVIDALREVMNGFLSGKIQSLSLHAALTAHAAIMRKLIEEKR